MNKTLLLSGVILTGISLFVGGFFFSQVNAQENLPGSMMGSWNGQTHPNMMGSGNFAGAPGMMGRGQYGGMMGSGMMGNFGDLTGVDPLSILEAETAVANYLATLNDENLSLGEIMIFDNHAYAQILDENSGIGAFEVLVDPVTQNVFPEPGPNMMWNTKYGMMSGDGNWGMMGGMMNGSGNFGMMSGMMNGQFSSGMMGGMMGGIGYAPDAEINLTAEEAVITAQEYLDAYLPGKTAKAVADAFPGYYTIHILEDGETTGMLSVNAYSGQVFLHHWHGDFIEMAGEGHE